MSIDRSKPSPEGKLDKSRLKSGNNLLTQALFLETNGWSRDKAVYTLGDEDIVHKDKVIYSIRRLYVAMEDIHEYAFANKYFYSWAHWQRLLKSPIVSPHIEEWRKELEAKITSRNLKRMEDLAAEGNPQAIKYMANRGWNGEPVPRKRGRPSKDEVTGELKRQAKESDVFESDWDRIQ